MAKTVRVPCKTKKKANKLILGGGLVKGTPPPKPTSQNKNNCGTNAGTWSATHT